MHSKMNNVAESQIAMNIITCISQENHKFCYIYFSFPKILSRFDSSDVCLWFEHFNFDSFLWTGITLPILIPERKIKFNIKFDLFYFISILSIFRYRE